MIGQVWREVPQLLLHDWLGREGGAWRRRARSGGAEGAPREARVRVLPPLPRPPFRGGLPSAVRTLSAAMDLAAAAEPGAGSQHPEVRDEVAEKCQKLFLDFLEE